MKTPVIVLALAILSLSISSCQKEITGEGKVPIDTTGTVNTGFLVKTYTEDVTSLTGQRFATTYNLSYDQSGRIKSLVSTTNAGDKFVYQYNSNNTYSMELFNSNVLSIHEDFLLIVLDLWIAQGSITMQVIPPLKSISTMIRSNWCN